MPTTKSTPLPFNNQLPTTVFALGAIVAVFGGLNFALAHFRSNKTDIPLPASSNMQRNIAIQEALKSGQKTYSYEPNFVPGIGNITDPEAYKKQFEESITGQ